MVASAIGEIGCTIHTAEVADCEAQLWALDFGTVGVKRTEEACRSIDVGIAVGDVAPDEITSP